MTSKRSYLWITVVIINLLFVILVGELYARIKHGEVLGLKAREAAYRRPDFDLHHSLVPGGEGRSVTKEWDVIYSINDRGLRDREYPAKKKENTFRILALGDSYTEGYGMPVDEVFVELLEKELNSVRPGDRDYEVINAGVASYSPLLEYLYLVKKGLQLDPDMVVLIYDFGDIKDDYEYEKTTVFDGNGLPVRCFPLKRIRAFSTNPVERFLVRHSRFYLYIENRINKLLYKIRKIGVSQYLQDNISQKEHDLFEKDESLEGDRFYVFREDDRGKIEKRWKRNEKYIDLIYRLLEEKQIPLVLVTYPNPMEVGETEWSEGRQGYGFTAGRIYPEPAVVDLMREYALKRDIPFIDLYPYFRDSDVSPLYFDFDGHFNSDGHKVAADGLYNELTKGPLSSIK